MHESEMRQGGEEKEEDEEVERRDSATVLLETVLRGETFVFPSHSPSPNLITSGKYNKPLMYRRVKTPFLQSSTSSPKL